MTDELKPAARASDLKRRTKAFALQVISIVDSLPKTRSSDVVARQLLRYGTAVGANYRSACRAKSQADFIAKMAIVEEEADESLYWMELLIESGMMDRAVLAGLMGEAEQLLAITVASIKTARGRSR